MEKKSEKQIQIYLSAFGKDQSKLTQDIRKFLIKKTNPSIEIVGDSTLSVNIGYGFTEKAWDCYCAIIVYSKHINISFPSGAFLTDATGILQGKGKRIRHIRVNQIEDLKSPEVEYLLLEARDLAVSQLSEKPKGLVKVRTIIKEIAGVKKRDLNPPPAPPLKWRGVVFKSDLTSINFQNSAA